VTPSAPLLALDVANACDVSPAAVAPAPVRQPAQGTWPTRRGGIGEGPANAPLGLRPHSRWRSTAFPGCSLPIERHFTANESVRDVAIGMSDGLTMPFALAAGLSGAVGSTGLVVVASPRSRPEGSRWAWAGTRRPGATPSTTPCARERPRGLDRVGGSLRPMGTPHRDARPPCPPASADRSILGHSLETLPLRAARVATATPPRSWRAARLSSTSAPCPPCAPARASRRLARSSRRWSPRGTRSPLQAASIASSWPATRRTVG